MAVAVVGGAIANKPANGGESWVRLSWIVGLRRLGYDVYFFERLDPRGCVDDAGRPAPPARSANLAHLQHVVDAFGLADRVGLLDHSGRVLHGLGGSALRELAGEAEVLFDLSGNLGPLARPATGGRGRSVFVDLDPCFTQTWHADSALRFSVAGYGHHVTVGLNVGSSGCEIPSAGLPWIPTLPPVLLDEWAGPAPPAGMPTGAFRFTTVSTWRTTHGSIALGGRTLGLKHHELRRFADMPRRAPEAEFELALDIDDADDGDREALLANGWGVVGARSRTATPASFRDYVRGSSGEFSVAQPAYVETGSGWFSDRTAAYLAAGRPALVQDTGIRDGLLTGEGLLTYTSPREAVAGVGRLTSDPRAHAQAARQLAVTHLDSDRVLGRLLERLGVGG